MLEMQIFYAHMEGCLIHNEGAAQFCKSLDQLDSAERLRVLERYMQYLMPRYASIQVSPIEDRIIEPLVIIRTKEELKG
jgi:hypothetical protein